MGKPEVQAQAHSLYKLPVPSVIKHKDFMCRRSVVSIYYAVTMVDNLRHIVCDILFWDGVVPVATDMTAKYTYLYQTHQ